MMQLTQKKMAASRILAVGVLLAALMAAFSLAAEPAHASTTFTVNSTEDHSDAILTTSACDTGYQVPGPGGAMVAECTLRAAIQQANFTVGADTVNFAIPGSGVKTISPDSQLPTITKPLTINGYSQPGAEPNTKAVGNDAVLEIQLSGDRTVGADGLVIGSSNSTVKGLVINRWSYAGIKIIGSGSTGNKITGNFIGTNASGEGAYFGNTEGVYVPEGSNNVIGGTTAAERNVISGNDENGVILFGSGNKVAGNYIGTDATGTRDLGNSDSGVYINGGSDNTVGGTEAGARNVISANDSEGVEISGNLTRGNKVLGNYVGTDKTGAAPLGNSDQGLYISSSPDNVIGGTTSAARNVISANDEEGVLIGGLGADGNKVLGNYVGIDKTGTAPLGNDDDGVYIFSAANITIGSTEAGARNVISANGGNAVEIYGDDATGNRVLSNSIFANAGLGIDLYGTAGPTPNDPDDPDAGPNKLQNFPILSSARKNAAGTTTIRGKLDSAPNSTFRLQFFSNPKGTDEGKTLLGSGIVSSDDSGDASFTFTTKKIRLGQNVTATATGQGGNTSEFSAPKNVVAS